MSNTAVLSTVVHDHGIGLLCPQPDSLHQLSDVFVHVTGGQVPDIVILMLLPMFSWSHL